MDYMDGCNIIPGLCKGRQESPCQHGAAQEKLNWPLLAFHEPRNVGGH